MGRMKGKSFGFSPTRSVWKIARQIDLLAMPVILNEKGCLAWCDEMIELAKRNFVVDGRLVPAILSLGMDKDGPFMATLPIQAFGVGERGKASMAEHMPAILEHTTAYAYLMLSEAWERTVNADEEDLRTAVAEGHPDAKEVLLFTFEMHQIYWVTTYEIVRPSPLALKPGPIELKLVDDKRPGPEHGRFSNFLRPDKRKEEIDLG